MTIPLGCVVLIADEAHALQNMASKRTQSFLKLTSHRTLCLAVMLLTGTPAKNGRPSNLFPLLRAVGHPLARDQRVLWVYYLLLASQRGRARKVRR